MSERSNSINTHSGETASVRSLNTEAKINKFKSLKISISNKLSAINSMGNTIKRNVDKSIKSAHSSMDKNVYVPLKILNDKLAVATLKGNIFAIKKSFSSLSKSEVEKSKKLLILYREGKIGFEDLQTLMTKSNAWRSWATAIRAFELIDTIPGGEKYKITDELKEFQDRVATICPDNNEFSLKSIGDKSAFEKLNPKDEDSWTLKDGAKKTLQEKKEIINDMIKDLDKLYPLYKDFDNYLNNNNFMKVFFPVDEVEIKEENTVSHFIEKNKNPAIKNINDMPEIDVEIPNVSKW